ncbi:diacylglycerol/lipid kinase family protein [Actinoplanes solisilvae]|uniref:diacylglycerol/lipid kinase family protein n=1 Tax=Actinoplanes solisilvae TaxID=2486853 RepID=UPI00196ACE8E|nr:diacylglycerol kinase family protein [Actinoplanes solisilvae]
MTTLPAPASSAQRWLARGAFVLAAASAGVLLGFAGLRGVSIGLVGAGGLAVIVASAYWFLAGRGLVRACAAALLVLAPLTVLVLYIRGELMWVALLSLALFLLAGAAGVAALAGDQEPTGMATYDAPPARHPFLVMNPRSGDGKVVRFGLQSKAEALGAEVALVDGPGTVDVAALARDAVACGADLLGVAGGDGTQALVAGIAAEHDLPFVVVSAGTRNHFALDLGLDREDPATCLRALVDGVETRVDLGLIGGRTFVNNASFGVYAEIVRSPQYRDDKTRTTLSLLPDQLAGHRGARLSVRVDDATVEAPQAVLVSNGPYGSTDLAGLGRRARLDRGVLGVVTVSVANARQAVGLLHRGSRRGLIRFTAPEVVVDADVAEIPVGIDGEAVLMPTPVRCGTVPGALRVRLPRNRPGVPAAKPAVDWIRLSRLALTRTP